MSTYSGYLGAFGYQDKNRLKEIINDDLPIYYENITNVTAETITPTSGSTIGSETTWSGMSITVAVEPDDVVFVYGRCDMSGDNIGSVWDLAVGSTAGLGSGSSSKWTVKENTTDGKYTSIYCHAVWYVSAAGNVTYNLETARHTDDDSSLYSFHRDFSILKFKQKGGTITTIS